PSPPPSPTPYIRRHSPNHPAPHEAAMNRTNASSVLPALASALAILALASAPTAAQRPAPPAGDGAVKPLPDSGVAYYTVGGERHGVSYFRQVRHPEVEYEAGDVFDVRPLPHGGRDVHVAQALGGAVPEHRRALRGGPQLRGPADPPDHADQQGGGEGDGQAGCVLRGRPPQRRDHGQRVHPVAREAPDRGVRQGRAHHEAAGRERDPPAAAEQPGRLEPVPA